MPNWPHIHIILNHLPIIGFPLLALLLAIGLVRRSRDLLLTASALGLLLGASTFPVKLSGDEAEEAVEELSWANDRLIHEHEEAAEAATIAALVSGLVAAAVWWRLRRQTTVTLGGPALLLAFLLGTSGLMVWTGFAGGAIRHDEFGAVRPPASREAEEREEH